MTQSTRALESTIRQLEKFHGPPRKPPTRDPFALILLEQVAYLVPDQRRLLAYGRLKKEVGITPKAIAAAPPELLQEIAREGGAIAAPLRAARMRQSAELVLKDWGGDLRAALKLPLAKARTALAKHPMIGRPAADRLLAQTGAHPTLGVDSNGLRVLLRLGVGEERNGYSATYKDVQAAAEARLPADAAILAAAAATLRTHGQTICREKAPDCPGCPVRRACPSATA